MVGNQRWGTKGLHNCWQSWLGDGLGWLGFLSSIKNLFRAYICLGLGSGKRILQEASHDGVFWWTKMVEVSKLFLFWWCFDLLLWKHDLKVFIFTYEILKALISMSRYSYWNLLVFILMKFFYTCKNHFRTQSRGFWVCVKF